MRYPDVGGIVNKTFDNLCYRPTAHKVALLAAVSESRSLLACRRREYLMPFSKSRILSRASPFYLEKLRPHLRLLQLHQGKVLAESRGPLNHVYFPHGGIISCVVELDNGSAIESGMIGNDGGFGAGQAIAGTV